MKAPAAAPPRPLADLWPTMDLVNSLPGHVALLDPVGVILLVNEAWRRFAVKNHLQGSDFNVGLNYLDICERACGAGSGEAHAVAIGIRGVLSGEAPNFTIDYSCDSPTGQRWFRLLVAPVSGQPILGALVMHFDVTANKLAELAALQTAAIVNFSDDAIIGEDLDGTITSWNHGAATLFGYTSDEIIGQPITRLIPPDWLAEEADILDQIKCGQRVSHFETRRQTKNGRLIDVSVTASPIKDSAGVIVGASKVVRDISRRKQAERMFAQTNSHCRSLFENMLEGYACCRMLFADNRPQDFIYLEVNKSFEKLTGLQDVIGKKASEVIPGVRESNPELFDLYGRVALTGIPEKCETFIAPLKGWFSISIYSTEKEHFTALFENITAPKETEAHLRLQSSALEAAANAIVITDRTGVIEWANPAFTKYTGYTLAEARGQNPRLLKSGHHDENFYHDLWSSISSGKVWQGEMINRRKDGTLYHEEMTITPVKESDGQINHYVAVKHDITSRKKMENELRASEAKFRGIFDGAKDSIFLIHDRHVVDCNATGLKLLGMTREQIIGKLPSSISPAFQPDGRDSHEKGLELMQRVLAGEPQSYEWTHLRADGTHVCTDITLNRLELDGEVYLQGIARDITGRKRADARIAHQAALLDNAQDAIVELDLDRKVLFWNHGAERLYGWTREEIMGRDVTEKLYGSYKQSEVIQTEVTRNGTWFGEITQLTKDRREIVVQSRRTLIRDHEGRPVSALVINTDITAKKKLEAQFFRAQRMESIGILAGGIAHDLNNILAPILMSIDILKATSENPEARKILETIEISAQRGADIVRQVLSFSRGMDGERIEVQLKHLLRDLEKIIKDTFPKDIRLQFSIPKDIWTVLGDPTQIHQILLNLCVNARDAMPHGGTLTVNVENCSLDAQYAAMSPKARPGRYVLLTVTDVGSGIAPEILDRIFEPFFTTKENGKGTGLGLSTAAAIIASHQGMIEVESKLGKGTTFKLYLPVSDLAAGELRQKTTQLNLPPGKGETILLVDDEPAILTITSQTLRKFGYQVLTATDGAQAVAVYATHQNEIALVLTDMMMPIMDGAATIHSLKRMDPTIKIIAATGVNSTVHAATAAGVKHLLVKPYTATALLSILRTALDEN